MLNLRYGQLLGFGHGYSKSCMIPEYNIFIDDSPHFAEDVRATGKVMFLYDRPWNKEVNAINCRKVKSLMMRKDDIIRVYTFDDVLKILL